MHKLSILLIKSIIIMAITNKIGAPVTGEDFFGRTKEVSLAHRYLNERQSLLLSAPRRIGKSSLAKKLLADKESQNWKCVYIDLQGIATKEAFLRKLINSFSGAGLMQKARKKVRDFIEFTFKITEGVEFGPLKIDLNHPAQLESMYNMLSDSFEYDDDTLIVIDELPLFLGKLMEDDGKNRDEVEFLLNWFRSLRQHENSHLRWLFCGSIGLRNFTNHYRMSQAINDLVDLNLGEFPENEARGLILALTKSYNLEMDNEVIKKTLDILQWPIPYFIQLLIDRVISKLYKPHGKTKVKIEDIQMAFDELTNSDYFITWDERLAEYSDLEYLARLILDSVAISNTGLSKDELIKIALRSVDVIQEPIVKRNIVKVLEMLEHDGYIMRYDDHRKFRSPLLREWWKYKFID